MGLIIQVRSVLTCLRGIGRVCVGSGQTLDRVLKILLDLDPDPKGLYKLDRDPIDPKGLGLGYRLFPLFLPNIIFNIS